MQYRGVELELKEYMPGEQVVPSQHVLLGAGTFSSKVPFYVVKSPHGMTVALTPEEAVKLHHKLVDQALVD